MIHKPLTLLLCACGMTGCLAHTDSPATLKTLDQLAQSQARLAETISRQKAPEVHVAPTDWKPLIDQLRAERQGASATATEPALYSGALVHLDARAGRCAPCDRLKHDLAQLERDTKWTVGTHGQVHWKLVLHERPDFLIPRVDFVIDGAIVRTVEGYAGPPTKLGYLGPLHLLVNQHPSVANRQ